MIVQKDCDVIPSSSDCLFCSFCPLSSLRSSLVDNWSLVYVVDDGTFVEIKVVDITSALCFVVEIVGGGFASSEENRNGLIIKNIAVKLAL